MFGHPDVDRVNQRMQHEETRRNRAKYLLYADVGMVAKPEKQKDAIEDKQNPSVS